MALMTNAFLICG